MLSNQGSNTDELLSSSPWNRIYQELREQCATSIPSMLSMLLYKVPWLLSLRFVGNIGAQELAAAALATTLCNVTGMSLSVGLSSALTTLTGQARGDLIAKKENLQRIRNNNGLDTQEEKKFSDEEGSPLLPKNSTNKAQQSAYENQESLPLVYLYRGIFIQMVLVIPVGVWWLYGIEPVLLALGQGQVLSEMTEKYLRILTPGLWSYSLNWTLTAWLQAIEMAHVPAYAAFCGLVLHIPINLLFIHVFHWGYLGVAAATVVFQLVQPILMLVYLFASRHGSAIVLERTTLGGHRATRGSFRNQLKQAVCSVSGICQYLSLAVPGIIIISEWWASEVSIFLSGRLSPDPAFALDGMTIYQSINTFCFMFPVGMSVAGSTRVGNLLGLGHTEGAKFAAGVNIVSAGLLSACMGSVLYLVPHTFFPSIFSPDKDVIVETSKTIPLLAVYVFADGVQIALNGVIKGCGRQCITMPIVVVAYWVVGVPLAYYIAFGLHDGYMCDGSYFCGIVGLVAGMTTGTWVHLLLLAVVVLGTTNWQREAQKAQERLTLEHPNVTHPETLSSPMIQRDDVSGVQHLNL